MTDQEERARIIALIEAHTREATRSSGRARRSLIDAGIYTEAGELAEECADENAAGATSAL